MLKYVAQIVKQGNVLNVQVLLFFQCFASQRKLGIMSPNLCCNNSKNR